MKQRIIVENAVGETRAAVFEGKQLTELYVRRWSDNLKPRAGDIFCGRITSIEKSLDAAFVDLGFGKPGFLKFSNAQNAPHMTEGQYIHAYVTREAAEGKGPVLRYADKAKEKKVGPVETQTLEDYLKDRFPKTRIEEASVNYIEDALEPFVALPNGGDIAIEPTRALTAIDVDKGRCISGYDVSIEASKMTARQVRLRGLGGLFVVDFPNLRQAKQRERLHKAFVRAFEDDPETIKIGPVSRFGTIEFTRSKTNLSLDEILLDAKGEPTVETKALRALRSLEKEGRVNGGSRLVLNVPSAVFAWLEEDNIGWRAEMTNRLGGRFEIKNTDKTNSCVDVL